ncbi:hypothetical protein SAMD00019534_010500 [Acytostelium subglobosum LB1]|uniref:hypothetical protein n=1 Tax=Acytostelium subglobosum LB1 TaxID=1410327 RepID=UPI0006448431|nr:hypothetical protein SAMD00019534_010500 [Acytostelium subglobosum LB1]GAM17875.1 hypothetical protein SAMD00019534_010500 [Acytostelium subglobosum LB1]|eukprot:XP_012758471.1 hypothetical protein SAMD00019534_010500 [Acytostelium subglobosum LB1]
MGVSYLQHQFKPMGTPRRDNLVIEDENGEVWLVEDNFESNIQLDLIQQKLERDFIGNYYSVRDVRRDESDYYGKCNQSLSLCCNQTISRTLVQDPQSHVEMFILSLSPSSLVSSAIIDVQGYREINITNQSTFQSPNLTISIQGSVNNVDAINIFQQYYLAFTDSNTTFLVPRSLVGTKENQIGMQPSTFLNRTTCDTPLGQFVQTNPNIDDQFAVVRGNTIERLLNGECNLQVGGVVPNFVLSCSNYQSFITFKLNAAQFPLVQANGVPSIVNTASLPFGDDRYYTEAIIDVNCPSGLCFVQFKSFMCCVDGADCSGQSINIYPSTKVSMVIDSNKTKRQSFYIQSRRAMSTSGYCKIAYFNGLKFVQNIQVNFTTTQFPPPPDTMVDDGAAPQSKDGRVFKSTYADICSSKVPPAYFYNGSCYTIPDCTGDRKFDTLARACRPNCPPDRTYYNPETLTCSTVPKCTNGTYDSVSGRCIQSIGGVNTCVVGDDPNCTSKNGTTPTFNTGIGNYGNVSVPQQVPSTSMSSGAVSID